MESNPYQSPSLQPREKQFPLSWWQVVALAAWVAGLLAVVCIVSYYQQLTLFVMAIIVVNYWALIHAVKAILIALYERFVVTRASAQPAATEPMPSPPG